MPPRPPISEPPKLRDYSDEHVAYEIDMLCLATIEAVANGEASVPALAQFARSARTEVFGLHLRNLIVFLYPDKFPPKNKDVCAHHFLDSRTPFEDWQQHRPSLSAVLVRAKGRADKELAHLTAARISGTPLHKNWDVCPLLRELNDVLVVFASRADTNRLGAKAQTAIANLSAWVTRFCPEGIVEPNVGS